VGEKRAQDILGDFEADAMGELCWHGDSTQTTTSRSHSAAT
jgi:hypothetical protein